MALRLWHFSCDLFSSFTFRNSSCLTHVLLSVDTLKERVIKWPCSVFQQTKRGNSLTEEDINEPSRVCSKHFLHGDSSNLPVLDLGKRFASPKKYDTCRGSRALKRASMRLSQPHGLPTKRLVTTPSPRASSVSAPTPGSTSDDEPMSVSIGEPLISDYRVRELPFQSDDEPNTVLAARIELLEAETRYLRSLVDVETTPELFRIERIANNDSLVTFYTGFASYEIF